MFNEQQDMKKLASVYCFDSISNYITRDNVVNGIDKILSKEKVAVVTGIPGVGKSRFADEYSKNKEKTADAVVRYFDAQSEDMLHSGYLSLACDLEIECQGLNKEALIRAIKNKMCNQPQSIFIFDNVKKYEDIEEYKKYLPENTQLIIISRNPQLFDGHLGKDCAISIEPFSLSETVKYLEKSFNSKIDRANIQKLAQEVGGIPYQLNHAVMYLNNNLSTGVAEYIEERNKGITGHDDPATTMLLDVLQTKEHGTLAWEMLQYAVYLEEGSLSAAIFENLFSINEQKTYWKHIVDHTYNRKDLDGALSLLTSLSLIEEHCDRGRTFYKMHNQTQEAIRKYTLSHHANIPVIPQEKLLSRLTTTVDNLLPDKIEEEHSKQQEMTPTYLNAIKLLEHFSNHNMDQNALASLYQKLGDYYEIMYDFDKQKSCYTKKLEILSNIHKGDHQNIANALDNVSIACYRLEQWKDALLYQEEALEMRQKLYPESHRDIVASLTNIGNTHGKLGEYEKALAYQENALQHARKLCPEENTSDIARCFLSIGYMHHALGKKEMNLAKTNEKLDKIDEALQHKKEAMQKFRTSLEYSNKSTEIFKTIHKNTDHVNVAKGLNNVGALREELGKIAQELQSQDEATEHFRAALDVQKQSLDMLKRLCADTPSVAVKIETVLLLYNVGVDYQKLGKAKEGLQYEGEALKLSKEMYKNSFYVADSLKHIGKNYQKFGDNNTALEYYINAYSMYQSLKEGDDELTTSKKYLDTLAKIRELNPNFVGSPLDQECKNREQIIKTGFKDAHVLTVQEKIQATILNDIYLKAKEQEWKTDLDVNLIQEQLGDLAKDQHNIEIAKMLCFEAMSLGIMHSQDKNLSSIVYFNRSNPTLIEQMLHEHPEYCVDGLILRECTRDQELLAQLLGHDMNDQAINQ